MTKTFKQFLVETRKGELLFFPHDGNHHPCIGLVVGYKNKKRLVVADLGYPNIAFNYLTDFELEAAIPIKTKDDIIKSVLLMAKHSFQHDSTIYLSNTISALEELGYNFPEFELIKQGY